jgi:hypothetical protein
MQRHSPFDPATVSQNRVRVKSDFRQPAGQGGRERASHGAICVRWRAKEPRNPGTNGMAVL